MALRQPSFSSLSGSLVMKSGQLIGVASENPVVALTDDDNYDPVTRSPPVTEFIEDESTIARMARRIRAQNAEKLKQWNIVPAAVVRSEGKSVNRVALKEQMTLAVEPSATFTRILTKGLELNTAVKRPFNSTQSPWSGAADKGSAVRRQGARLKRTLSDEDLIVKFIVIDDQDGTNAREPQEVELDDRYGRLKGIVTDGRVAAALLRVSGYTPGIQIVDQLRELRLECAARVWVSEARVIAEVLKEIGQPTESDEGYFVLKGASQREWTQDTEQKVTAGFGETGLLSVRVPILFDRRSELASLDRTARQGLGKA